jgi:hypothetical protein
MANNPVINSFNAGELSPYMYARNDLSKYNSGCIVMENWSVLPYGGAVNRPCIKFVAESKLNDKVRIISFEFSSSDAYILELGNEYVRFYKNNEPVLDGATPYEIVSPWSSDDLFGLKYIQSADVVWLCHSDYPVYKLSRYGDTNWTLEEMTPDYPALLEENITDITLTVSALTGTGITITSSESLFDANHVGSYWEIKHPRDDNILTVINNIGAGPAHPSGTSNTISGKGTYSFITTGTWSASDDVAVWRSEDGGDSWSKWRQYNMDSRNVDVTWDESDSSVLYCVTATAATAKIRLFVQDYYTKGLVKITGYTSDTVVTADVINAIGSTDATKLWSEGAWNTYRGYPKCCALWESRLIFAGTNYNANTLWLSRIDDFENFELGTLDDDAMKITIRSGPFDDIVWMVPQKMLVIGTVGSEWTLGAQSNENPVTPSEFSLKRKTTYGSNNIQAVLINSAVLFVMRQGRKLREFTYRYDIDDWVAPDLTILAEHITKGGVVDIAYQQQPDNILHMIRADGTLVPMVYERDQDVTALSRWTLNGGSFESVVSIARDNDEDQIWVSCSLEIDGSTKRYIGYFDNREWGDNIATEATGSDFYTVVNNPASTTISGLDYLEGRTVDILRDGMVDPQQTVTGGEITLIKEGASRVVIGIPKTCIMAPMYIEPAAQYQQPMGKKKGVYRAVIRFKDTIHAKVGQDLDHLSTITFRTTEDILDTQVPLYSGEKKISFANDYRYLHTCYIVQDKPLPIQVIAMIPDVEIFK